MILDVGCGTVPHGDVNVDLHPEPTPHRCRTRGGLSSSLDMKKTPNFIKADAQHLPFQNGAFHTVVSYHTIEHVDNPTLMLKEMLRVAKRTVMVVCPHRYSERAGKFKVHKNFLNKKWFVEVLKKMEVNIYEINYSKWRYFPHVTVPIVRFPCEMVTKIMKPRI